jgi:RNA polymerase sigma factor (sigma-70 family)
MSPDEPDLPEDEELTDLLEAVAAGLVPAPGSDGADSGAGSCRDWLGEDQHVVELLAQAMRQALERLPADYQRVLKLRHQQGQSFPDIAQALGRSVGAVRELWFRAVERLKEEMKGRHDSG